MTRSIFPKSLPCSENSSIADPVILSIVVVTANLPHQSFSNFVKNASEQIHVPHEWIIVNQAGHNFSKIANCGILEANGKYICFVREADVFKKNFPRTSGHFVTSRLAMSCVGFFNERFSSFKNAVGEYQSRLKAKGYRQFSLKLILQSKQKSDHRLLPKTNSINSILTGRRKASQIEIEWRLRKYLLSRRKIEKPNILPKHSSIHIQPGKTSQKLIRTGFAIRSKNGKQIEAVASLQNKEIFSLDPVSKKIWGLLDGSISAEKITGRLGEKHLGIEVEEYLKALRKCGLVANYSPFLPSSPLVTIMMPAHNAMRWIRETIESVLNQTFQSFELIMMDDGSSDQTFQLAKPYQRDPRIKLFKNQKQIGVSATRNRILSLARGKYIAVCDSDDLMFPSFLERFVNILETDPKVGWIYGERLKIDESGHPIAIDPVLLKEKRNDFRRNIVAFAGSVIRKSAILRAGGFDEALLSNEDYVLALQIAGFTQFLVLSGEVHYIWRKHPESISETNPWSLHGADRWTKKFAQTLNR